MILTNETIDYFKTINSRIIQTSITGSKYPYFLEGDDFLKKYESIRMVWLNDASVNSACDKFGLARSTYYACEKNFLSIGTPGLFSLPRNALQFTAAEALTLLAKRAKPTLSYTAIFRICQSIPLTKDIDNPKIISKILLSHGYGLSDMETDTKFWERIQRTLKIWSKMTTTNIEGRSINERKKTFFKNEDICQKRLELIRYMFYHSDSTVNQACNKFGITPATFYRLITDYKVFGPWAIIPAFSNGKEGMSANLQLTIILEKLKNPEWTPETLITVLKLKNVSRFAVHRVFDRWGLKDKIHNPIALDEYITSVPQSIAFNPIRTAYHILSEEELLSSRRINRHFEKIANKMKTRSFNVCDPGPFLLAPFINNLGIVQSFEIYGPPKLRGKELTNLALLNIFRILSGYRRINHLSNNQDRSVAMASGIGMFGSTSKYYDDTIDFKFDQLYKMRCDLVARAKELGLIDGLKIGMDFHFKQFYGKNSKEKNIGKGPNKAGDLVPGFRPHIVWDIATNVILNMAYFQGSTRAPRIMEQFCEQNIFPLIDPLAIEEIYFDSEYTKESHMQYLKEVKCKNGDIYVCLKKNKQIKKLISTALSEDKGWEYHDEEDDSKMIQTQLPNSKLDISIVILREREEKKNKKRNIRCFGSTNMKISKKEILDKYRYRWVIENGIKDLVSSYFMDEIYGIDPEKIEFEFYCVMVARLAYENFLKELGGKYFQNENGDKCTLQRMRNLLFEKRNCTIHQNNDGNFILTNLDVSPDYNLYKEVSKMLQRLKEEGKNKVMWWDQRSILFESKEQFSD